MKKQKKNNASNYNSSLSCFSSSADASSSLSSSALVSAAFASSIQIKKYDFS
jgi:hypothetical protein